MAVESKPLFHPEVMRQQVRSFSLPERVAARQPKLQHWASLIASGRADELKETALLPEFLSDIFCGLLGYTGPAGEGDAYTLSRERHVEADGEVADAVLGRFRKDKEQCVLGHIFEQSITDLERLRESLETNGRASVPASPNSSETPASQGSRGRSPHSH